MAGKKKAGHRGGSSLTRDLFSLSCKVLPTKETFQLDKVLPDMTIKQLKSDCELATGIPYHLQRLCYLDEGELLEHTDVKSNDIVAGGVLHLDVWNTWHALIEAAASDDRDTLFQLGMSQDSTFQTPISKQMTPNARAAWIANRAFVALFIASHRGHKRLCQKLIAAGADVNAKTSQGRSALHVAAAQDNGFIVDLLLEKGADIDTADKNGDTALSIANRFGNKGCERHLFLFRWQQRAKQMKPKENLELFAHQYFDSSFPVWLQGDQAQLYYSQILPPGEFEGTSLSAPRRKPFSRDGKEEEGFAGRPSGPQTTENIVTGWQQGDSNMVPQASMPAIAEESASSNLSQPGGYHSSPPIHQRVQDGNVAFCRSSDSGPKANGGFDEWLRRKQLAEQRVMDRQKRELARQQQVEDDRRRHQDIQDKSYDNWLAEKESGKKGQPSQAGGSSGPAVYSGSSKSSSNADAIIRSILKRREEEGHGAGQTWLLDHWLADRESGQLLEHIRAGTTPLQLRLKEQGS